MMKVFMIVLVLIMAGCNKNVPVIGNGSTDVDSIVKKFDAEILGDSIFYTTYDFQLNLDTLTNYCDKDFTLNIDNIYTEDSINYIIISNNMKNIIYKLNVPSTGIDSIKNRNINFLIFRPKEIRPLYNYMSLDNDPTIYIERNFNYTLINGKYLHSQ